MINIKLQPEYIAWLWGFPVSNSLLTAFLVTLFLTIFALFIYLNRNQNNRLILIIRILLLELLKLTDSVTGDRNFSKKNPAFDCHFFRFYRFSQSNRFDSGFFGSFFCDS